MVNGDDVLDIINLKFRDEKNILDQTYGEKNVYYNFEILFLSVLLCFKSTYKSKVEKVQLTLIEKYNYRCWKNKIHAAGKVSKLKIK